MAVPGSTEEVRFTVVGADVRELWDWLSGAPELRGRLRLADGEGPPDTMGMPVELAVALAAAAPATVAALARAVSSWLFQQRSDVVVEVFDPRGGRRSLSAQRLKDPEHVVRILLESLESGPASGDPGGRQLGSGSRRIDDDTSA